VRATCCQGSNKRIWTLLAATISYSIELVYSKVEFNCNSALGYSAPYVGFATR
jgi:hypothetical protein